MSNATLVQSDTTLYAVSEDGSSVALTKPSTVTISATKTPRFEVNGVHAVLVNSVDQPLIVDDAGIALFMSPIAPTAAPTLGSSAGAGALTGTYSVKYTFAIRTIADTVVAESGFSPSASVTVATKKIAVSAVQTLSGLTAADYDDRYEVVRRFYRTTNGGSTYFLWYTITDNTTTLFEDDATDAAISAIAADNLGTVPFLSNIASFHDRLFGVNDSENREQLLYSETGLRWAWPTDNVFTMPQVKGDSQSGITALMPRRDALGIAKSSMLISLTGTDDNDFQLVNLSTSIGCVSQETAALYRDAWYFLGQDGVYKWSENGLDCISDANERRGGVRSWFTTDTYFNRAEFVNAFGIIDVIDKSYYLAVTNLDAEIVWLEYDIESDTWWGPHRTDEVDFSFTSMIRLASDSPLIGFGSSAGYIAVQTDTRSDDTTTAIEVEATTAPLRSVDPPATSHWGTLYIETEPQTSGSLSIYPTIGELSDGEQAVMTHDLTDPQEGLGRLGYGRYAKLRFYINSIDTVLQILGFEIDPVHPVGRRE